MLPPLSLRGSVKTGPNLSSCLFRVLFPICKPAELSVGGGFVLVLTKAYLGVGLNSGLCEVGSTLLAIDKPTVETDLMELDMYFVGRLATNKKNSKVNHYF